MNPLREALAQHAHESWCGWMRYLFSKATKHPDGSVTIPPWAAARWTRQMNTPYDELPEQERESDRAEADKMLILVRDALIAKLRAA